MAVGRQLAIDRLSQVQIPDDGGGPQVKDLLHSLFQLLIPHRTGTEGIHQHADGLGHADGVGQLHLALPGQSCRHDVLGHPAGGVSSGAVHLGGVLAGEAAAAVRGAAAIGIHDDLPTGEAAVTLRAADDEPAGGVHIDLRILVQQFCGNSGLDDHIDHILADLLQRHLGAVLGGEHHGIHPDGLLAVILHSDLSLAVRPQIVHKSGLADLGKLPGHFMRQRNRQGHQLRGLIAGVAEHHALIAGAVIQLGLAGFLGLQRLVHAQSDIAGLLVDVGNNTAGIAVKAVLGAVITDIPDNFPGDLGNIHVAAGGDLAHDVYQAGGSGGLAGHASVGVLGQNGVQHRVRDLVADLVGVALSHGFRGK